MEIMNDKMPCNAGHFLYGVYQWLILMDECKMATNKKP